jgi:hypothetical protein
MLIPAICGRCSDPAYVPIDYFQVATRPLGERVAHILAERQGIWDTGKIMFSLSRDAADRLIIGSMGAAIGGEGGLSERWAKTTVGAAFSFARNRRIGDLLGTGRSP